MSQFLYEAVAINNHDDGKVKLTKGMNVEFVAEVRDILGSSVWTGNTVRRRIAEAFVHKYGLSCSPSEFERVVNNVNFKYTLL